jgi:PPOX class probable F420-dependent enzyme
MCGLRFENSPLLELHVREDHPRHGTSAEPRPGNLAGVPSPRPHQDSPVSVEDGYFAPLASAKYALLTTSNPDGSQASAVVRGVVIGDRAYVWTWSYSDTARNLRHDGQVQVAPCAARGLLCLAPPVEAVARLLPDQEASQVAGELARKSSAPRHFRLPGLRRAHRARRGRMVHYELLPCASAAAMTPDQAAAHAPGGSAAGPPGREPGAPQVTVVRSSAPFPWPP